MPFIMSQILQSFGALVHVTGPEPLSCQLHLQVQFNCLEKVNPVTHAVGNVAKRIFVIGFSLLVFSKWIRNIRSNHASLQRLFYAF